MGFVSSETMLLKAILETQTGSIYKECKHSDKWIGKNTIFKVNIV